MNYKKIGSYLWIFVFWLISSCIYLATQGRSFEGLPGLMKQINAFFVDLPIFLLMLLNIINAPNIVIVFWLLFYFIVIFFAFRRAYKILFASPGNLGVFIFLSGFFLLGHFLAMLIMREMSEDLGRSILSIFKAH